MANEVARGTLRRGATDRHDLLRRVDQVATLANNGKLARLLMNPARYLSTAWFNQIVYPRQKKAKVVTGKTFYGYDFKLGLPAGTDIYLTGGKTHPSELRLSRYMIRHFKEGDHYVDVGGHYGFFAGLAKRLVLDGQVDVFEPAPDTFSFLQQNLGQTDIRLHQSGLADEPGQLTFYQFPALYSEFNSLDVEQYRLESWFADYPPRAVEVPITTVDEMFTTPPEWLKIDVEGVEDLVILGGKKLLAAGQTVISMEYLPASSSNGSHARARTSLEDMGYQTFRLSEEGLPLPCPDPEDWMRKDHLDSVNLIFATQLPSPLL